MPTVADIATTFNVPNYHGELIQLTPSDHPFLSALGTLSPGGGKVEAGRFFSWAEYDLRAPDEDRARIEAAPAPDPEARDRTPRFNVIQTHLEATAVGYEKQAATSQFGVVPGTNDQHTQGANPVTNELAWQIEQAWKQVGRDVEASLIAGTFQIPADNSTAYKTRGILQAIETNVHHYDVAQAFDEYDFLNVLSESYEAGGFAEQSNAILMVHPVQLLWLNEVLLRGRGYEEGESRTVAGINLQTIVTPFGDFGIMKNRYMPKDVIAGVDLGQCDVRFLNVPGRGVAFVESLAKDGARDKVQLYTSVGLEYGDERAHFKMTGLTDSPPDGS